MEVKFTIRDSYKGKDLTVYSTEHLQLKARIAIDFAKNYGMVADIEDGEDSSGRAKLRLMTAPELATRALDVAHHLVDGIRERGWTLALPDLADLDTSQEE